MRVLIKANQTGIIDVNAAPFSGQNDGRDADNQFFSEDTDFMEDRIKNPVVFHHHGVLGGSFTDPVGEVIDRWVNKEGVWFRIKLSLDAKKEKVREKVKELWEAAKKGMLFASSGAVPASVDFDEETGHIKSWLIGDISLINLAAGETPKNFHATAVPAKGFTNENGRTDLDDLKIFYPEMEDEEGEEISPVKAAQMFCEGVAQEVAELSGVPTDVLCQAMEQTYHRMFGETINLRGENMSEKDNSEEIKKAAEEAERLKRLEEENLFLKAQNAAQSHKATITALVQQGRVSPAEVDALVDLFGKAYTADVFMKSSTDASMVKSIIAFLETRPARDTTPSLAPDGVTFMNNNEGMTPDQVSQSYLERMKSFKPSLREAT